MTSRAVVDAARAQDEATPAPRLLSPGLRLTVLAVVALVLLAAGVGAAAGIPVLRGTAVAVFLLALVGAVPCLLVRPRAQLAGFAVMSVATSQAITITLGFAMAELRIWHPVALFVIVAVATVLGGVPLVVADLTGSVGSPGVARSAWTRFDRRRLTAAVLHPDALAVLGVSVCALVAVLHESPPQPNGLWLRLGPGWYVGLLLLVISAVWAWRTGRSPAVAVTALAVVVVLSQAIAYGAPASMTAARHVGVTSYIIANHRVDPSLDIYQAWCGLFAGAAWLCSAGGIGDPMTLATWWPVLLSAALVVAVRVLAQRLGLSRARAWAAALLFGLANTLNITFFSPQSLGIFLAVVIFAVACGLPVAGPVRRRSLLMILWLGAVMAVVHEVSPYLTVAALVALVLLRRVRPWWTPALVLGPAVAWALVNRGDLGRFVSISLIGHVFSNAHPPTHSGAGLGETALNRFTFDLPALVLVLIGLTALLAVVLRSQRGDVALLLAAVSPVSLFFVSNYGDEGIFRVALFALPWLAVLAVSVPYPLLLRLDKREVAVTLRPRVAVAAGLALVAALSVVNVFGQTGLDWARVVRPDETAATRHFELSAPTNAVLLATGAADAMPSDVTRRYLQVHYSTRQGLGDIPNPKLTYQPAADVDQMTRDLLAAYPHAPAYYALVSQAIGGYDQEYGYQSYANYRLFATAMAASPLWRVVRAGPTTTLYRLVARPPAAAGGSG